MNFILRLAVMFLALGGILFAIWKLNTGGINPSLFQFEVQEPASFDPGEVTHFEWKSFKKIFSYDRDNGGDWLPEKNEERLNDLLNFLSQIQLQPVEQKGTPSLEVFLDIQGVRWGGAWDGLSFVWKQGPKAGMGEILSEQKNIMFFRGAHIFDSLEFNLCKNRISKIYVQAHGKNYKIEQVQNTWSVTEPAPQTLNPVFIEKWLVGLCQVKLKSLLDLSYAQSNTKQGAVTFEFLNGEKISLAHVEKDFFITHEMGLILENLNSSIEELKKQLLEQTNP